MHPMLQKKFSFVSYSEYAIKQLTELFDSVECVTELSLTTKSTKFVYK